MKSNKNTINNGALMHTETINKNLSLISLILRLSIGSLFLGAAIIKVQGGIEGNISYYT